MPDPFVMKGVLGGFERASQTLLNVSLKKRELEREKKSDDISYKIKGLQLQKLESQMDPQLWAIESQALKDEIKFKKAMQGFALSQLGIAEFGAKSESDKLDNYARGLVDSYDSEGAGGILGEDGIMRPTRRNELSRNIGQAPGFQLGTMELDLEAGLKGQFPLKQLRSPEVLSREKATEEISRRRVARQPLDTRVLEPRKGFLGFGGNTETVEFAKTIETRQDLINLILNADALEDRGINTAQIEDLYEEELLKLAAEGYLSEK